jgi:glutaconate CoA-transferase subunit B
VLRPADGGELELVALHPGVEVEQAREATGWELRVAADLATTDPVTDRELDTLRDLRASARA